MSCQDALSHQYFMIQSQHPLYLHAPVSSGLPSGLPPQPVLYDPVAQATAQAHAAFTQQTAYLYQQQQQVAAQQQAAQAQAAQAAAHGMHPQHHLQHSGAAPMTGVMPAPSGTQHGYMPPNPYMNMPYQKR
jgi:hypothetical protein